MCQFCCFFLRVIRQNVLSSKSVVEGLYDANQASRFDRVVVNVSELELELELESARRSVHILSLWVHSAQFLLKDEPPS